MIKRIFLSSLTICLFMSCAKNRPDPGGTMASPVANEWWVTVKLTDGTDVGGTYYKVATYNTSENKDSIWIDDLQNTIGFKSKALANYKDLLFQTANAANEYGDNHVTIANGKVFRNGGHSVTGNVTDSIYFEITLDDDPSTTYVISGYGRTMYAEDDF